MYWRGSLKGYKRADKPAELSLTLIVKKEKNISHNFEIKTIEILACTQVSTPVCWRKTREMKHLIHSHFVYQVFYELETNLLLQMFLRKLENVTQLSLHGHTL